MNKNIGFIGLGNMGLPMAHNLISSGYNLTVYDKDLERARSLLECGAVLAESPADVITSGCIVITMVSDDKALLEIVSGNKGIAKSLTHKEAHVAMSTVSPDTIQRVFEIHQKDGVGFLAAPVLGRPVAAETKKLWVFLAGDPLLKGKISHIFDNFSQGIYDFGDNIIAANMVKLAINFLILSAIESMGEAIAFVKKSGLDYNVFADVVTQTLFACSGYQYHAHNIASQTFAPAGFKLSLGLKDISLLMAKARDINMPMPICNLLYDRLLSGLAKKRANLDWSSITLGVLEDADLDVIINNNIVT